MDAIRVLLVDDHRMFLQGLHALLESEPDIVVVGECGDGVQAVTTAGQARPDVILIDVNMPRLDGIAATRQITARYPETAVIVLTMYQDDTQLFQAVKNGARGYILKSVDTADLVAAIRAVARGESAIDPKLMTRLLAEFGRLWEQPTPQQRTGLSDREVEILRYIARGGSNREIGRLLNFSEQTIKNAITTIYQKLHITDRTQAAVYAVREGLIAPDEAAMLGEADGPPD